LSFLLSEEAVEEVLQRRQKLWGERALRRDSKTKKTCFWISSFIFAILAYLLLQNKRSTWLTNSHGTLDVWWILVLAALSGLLSGLVIGIGLIANLLISYAYLIEEKLASFKRKFKRPNKPLSKDEWDVTWKEYELHIGLYKYYMDLGLKANLFFYFITGGILGIYFRNPVSRLMKFSLLLPVLMSLAFGGVFIHGGMLWMRVSDVIREIRRELKLKKAPDINLLSLLLFVFGTIFLIVGVSMVLLAIFT
jgi:uncharacterized membrane protein YciS (DUF1049 family)